jgi:hypothetical protein
MRNFLLMDMSEMKLKLIKKKTQGGKNLCSTRDQVAKLFIAILANCGFRVGGWGAYAKDGPMIAYRNTDRTLDTGGGHFVFNICVIRGCSRHAGSTSHTGKAFVE